MSHSVGRPGIIPVAALLVLVLALSPPTSGAQSQKDRTVFDRLEQKAWSEGRVHVIVRLDVPSLEELTAASAQFVTGDIDESQKESLAAADAALKSAIEAASWRVISDLQGTEFSVMSRYNSLPFLALRISPQALNLLYNSPFVLGIEENVPVRLDEPVEAPEITKPGAVNPWPGDRDKPLLDNTVNIVGASTAWSWGFTGSGWYVAVLDTGIRKSHQFFTGKNTVEACFALGRDGASGAGDCPNGNAIMTGPGSAAHHPSDHSAFDHGTHVSGIAAGNYGSLAGVAKGAGIIAVQVFSKFTPSDCGSSSPCLSSWNSDSLAGLDYVYSLRGAYKIAAVNMSLGGSIRYSSFCDSDSRKTAIDNLRSVGIATAIATGNNGSCVGISAPGCISSAVSVGSTTDSDAESSFNNWHATLQRLFAPGSSINSSTGVSDSSYSSWNGTSMATPHVAGAWALLRQARGDLSVTDLLNTLRTTGVNIYSVCDNRATAIPRFRVDRAIQQIIKFVLTLQTSAFGTTNPVPATYSYAPGAQVQIAAVPDQYAIFMNWSGSASGSANPLSVTMDGDKTIKANFSYIYPPIASGRKVVNRNFAQAEYIGYLTWQAPAENQGLDIAKYKIYTKSGDTLTLLVEVAGDKREYQHRNIGKASVTYAIAALTSSGREGEPAVVSIQ